MWVDGDFMALLLLFFFCFAPRLRASLHLHRCTLHNTREPSAARNNHSVIHSSIQCLKSETSVRASSSSS
uniref:Putative secreted protein n=1 Tax=Anopheles darlingi TaxID=43151 RepID=A0A2M4DID0_ANODA